MSGAAPHQDWPLTLFVAIALVVWLGPLHAGWPPSAWGILSVAELTRARGPGSRPEYADQHHPPQYPDPLSATSTYCAPYCLCLHLRQSSPLGSNLCYVPHYPMVSEIRAAQPKKPNPTLLAAPRPKNAPESEANPKPSERMKTHTYSYTAFALDLSSNQLKFLPRIAPQVSRYGRQLWTLSDASHSHA